MDHYRYTIRARVQFTIGSPTVSTSSEKIDDTKSPTV
jgi:hypothetical protein